MHLEQISLESSAQPSFEIMVRNFFNSMSLSLTHDDDGCYEKFIIKGVVQSWHEIWLACYSHAVHFTKWISLSFMPPFPHCDTAQCEKTFQKWKLAFLGDFWKLWEPWYASIKSIFSLVFCGFFKTYSSVIYERGLYAIFFSLFLLWIFNAWHT